MTSNREIELIKRRLPEPAAAADGPQIGWFIRSEQSPDGTWNTIAAEAIWDLLNTADKWRSIWWTLTMTRDSDYGYALVKRLLREGCAIPPEGAALWAEMLDSKNQLFDFRLYKKMTKSGAAHQQREKRKFEMTKKVMAKKKEQGISQTKAGEILFEESDARQARRAMRENKGCQLRENGKPWAPWDE
jgi:hypothetical protein